MNCQLPFSARSAVPLLGGLGGAANSTGLPMMDGSRRHHLAFLKGENAESGMTPQEYMLLHPRCAICHWPATRKGRSLELHHIIGGAGRKNLPDGSNFLCLCGRCHHFLHGVSEDKGGIPPGAILFAKIEEDGYVDLDKLAQLKHRNALPYDVCEIPEQYLEDRKRNGGKPWP